MRLPLLVLLLLTPAFAQWSDLSAEYLGLTQDQSRRIALNQGAHYEWMKPQQARVELVTSEIVEESLRIPLDPLALGLRYAELEAIRREDLERRDRLVRLNRSVLTEAQNSRAIILEGAEGLWFTARDADCRFLIYEDNPRACGLLSIDLKTPPAPGPGPAITIYDPVTYVPAAFDRTKPLRDFLALTPEQSAAYLRNLNDLQTRQDRFAWSIHCAEENANRSLLGSPLSPAAIGAGKAAVIEARRAMEEIYKAAVATNQGLLTPAQRERLNVLEQARQVIGTADLAANFAMLPGPPVAEETYLRFPAAILFGGSCGGSLPVQGSP